MSKGFESSFSYRLIYVFSINDSVHKGLLKIGDTTLKCNDSIDSLPPNCKKLNQAARERINSYTNTAGIAYELLHTELAVRTDINKGTLKSFGDHDVHAVLVNSGIKKVTIKNTKAREWFKVDLTTVRKAIEAVKQSRATLNPSDVGTDFIPVVFRPEQETAIKMTLKEFKSGNRMLWNAKMRFGKTLSALEVVRQMGCGKTIIATHRPVVDSGWYEDFNKIFHFEEDFIYGSKAKGSSIENLLSSGKKFIYFASIQDLRGSEKVGGKHDKNSAVFDTIWDMVIVDEAHEGTTTALGEEVIRNLVTENTKFLALSGTPFNILGNYDENVYTWDYIMEQRCKEEWDKEHFGDSNPYAELPKMNIFVYDLGELLDKKYVELEDKAFNFHEFFRTWTGDIKRDFKPMPQDAKVGDFVHADDVWSFLNLITKADEESQYPYSTDEYRDIFRHSLWMLPGVREALALQKMMKKHPVFSFMSIVNVAGNGDEEEKSETALNKVLNAIETAGDSGYTITLSCGKLTTGVTVKEWNTVLMLSGTFSTSASSYLQTIFRVQSPCNKNGKIKDNCYVFDFAPDRTLKMVAESVALSTKAGKTSDSDRVILGEFLNYCPVISVSGTIMKKYSTNSLLQQLKRAYAERAVQNGFDDANLYNDELLKLSDLDLKEFDKLKKIIGKAKAQPKSNEIEINNQGFTDEEYKEIDRIEKKKPKDRTPEEQAKLDELKKKKENRKNAISILRSISIRIPLLIYGANIPFSEDFTLDKLLDDKIVDEASWAEFMPKGITKDLFRQFLKYYDPDIFVAAGRKIRNIVRSADELPPTERVRRIAELQSCFKNPDKETVLTPWRVVNMHMSDCLGGYSFYEENPPVGAVMLEEPRFVDRGKITADTFSNANACVLEINSKTGLYPLYVVYSIFKMRCNDYPEDELTLSKQLELWDKTVSENMYVICKTPMAKHITRRTLLGYRKSEFNAHYFDDLVNMMKNKPDNFVSKVSRPAYWKKKGELMKFDAVVGNPPYQLNVGVEKDNYAVPLYNDFVTSGKALNPKYLSMIIPARWYAGGRNLDDFRNSMLSDFRMRIIFDYPNAVECFPLADISGGVCYFLWNSEETSDECCTVKTVQNGTVVSEMVRPLLEDGCDTFIRFNEAVPIFRKIRAKNEPTFESLVSPQTPFGFYSSFKDYKLNYFDGGVKIHTVDGIGYVNRSQIKKGIDLVDRYKVYISKSYGERGDYPYFFLGKPFIGDKNSCCTQTYLCIGPFNDEETSKNVMSYIKTRFFRFCIMLKRNTQDAMRGVYAFVPMQDFSKPWSDEELYAKYGLTEDEIAFIESMVKPMP